MRYFINLVIAVIRIENISHSNDVSNMLSIVLQ